MPGELGSDLPGAEGRGFAGFHRVHIPLHHLVRQAARQSQIPLTETRLHLRQRLQNRRVFVHVALTRRELGVFHPAVFFPEVLMQMLREQFECSGDFGIGARLQTGHRFGEFLVHPIHRRVAQQQAVVPLQEFR